MSQVNKLSILLCSLNAVPKEPTTMAVGLGWASPDPGLGSMVELSRRHVRGWLNLIGIGETLSGKRIAAEEAPPSLL